MEKGSTSCKPQKHQVILISLGIRSGDGFDGRRVAGFTSRFHPHHFTSVALDALFEWLKMKANINS
jgi:hypothetical protein